MAKRLTKRQLLKRIARYANFNNAIIKSALKNKNGVVFNELVKAL